MTAVKSDLEKLEELLNSATNERQRKMYQALLKKARAKLTPVAEASPEKTIKSPTETVDATAECRSAKSTKKKSKVKSQAKDKTLDSANDDHSKKKDRGAIAIDEGSIASSKTQSSSKKQSSKTKKKVFQAVGIIKGTPYLEDEKLFITINGIKYDLKRGAGRLNKPFEELKSELESNGSGEMFLRVYPNITHYREGREIGYSFVLVRPYHIQAQYPGYPEGFIFRGVWRSITYCPTPVISIYRNLETLPIYKRLSTTAQKFFVRSQDFPVVWSAPVEPFIYNPQLPKSEQMPRYFVEVEATFFDGQYIVTEMLSEPSLKIPGFVKPKKKTINTVQQPDLKSESTSSELELTNSSKSKDKSLADLSQNSQFNNNQ